MMPSTNMEHARAVLRQHRDALMATDGVTGVGIGRDAETGKYHIVVYLLSAAAGVRLTPQIEGIDLRAVVTGEFRAS